MENTQLKTARLKTTVKWLDMIYKTLIVFIATWILAVVIINRSHIQAVVGSQQQIQKDLTTIKSSAINIFTNQTTINKKVQDQLINNGGMDR